MFEIKLQIFLLIKSEKFVLNGMFSFVNMLDSFGLLTPGGVLGLEYVLSVGKILFQSIHFCCWFWINDFHTTGNTVTDDITAL